VGEAVDPDKHQPAVEIKGATYTELKVGGTNPGDGWPSVWWTCEMNPDKFERVSDVEWRIAPFGKMRVPAVIYADETLIP